MEDPSAPSPMPRTSDVLPVGEGYRLVKCIGTGTFGEVWEARAPETFPPP